LIYILFANAAPDEVPSNERIERRGGQKMSFIDSH